MMHAEPRKFPQDLELAEKFDVRIKRVRYFKTFVNVWNGGCQSNYCQ